ncbi:PAAR motif family protein [Ralstonia solanacearum]|nr:PAAR motif family protein [Ralstonia solanacearum]QKL50924.1 PAAR domain-containing protein [Ralstonia solanacearum]QKM22179.1 PAAR domain-containing protein [Ralstonia solanacearum]QKM26987.1 PAAR domain-containing protein [Ralstonia solanacearum]
MRGIIRVGDAPSHGGRVQIGAPASDVMGRPVARKGDLCICLIQGHQSCVIVEGDENVIVNGQPAAFSAR